MADVGWGSARRVRLGVKTTCSHICGAPTLLTHASGTTLRQTGVFAFTGSSRDGTFPDARSIEVQWARAAHEQDERDVVATEH
jgi:hypothetical protein